MNESLIKSIAACPACKGSLEICPQLTCAACGLEFPVVDGIPILINEANSIFSIEDFKQGRLTTYGSPLKGWKRLVSKFIPSINLNLGSDQNYKDFFERLRAKRPRPQVLILGGAIEGRALFLNRSLTNSNSLKPTFLLALGQGSYATHMIFRSKMNRLTA